MPFESKGHRCQTGQRPPSPAFSPTCTPTGCRPWPRRISRPTSTRGGCWRRLPTATALRHYQYELYPALAGLGATLVAVSPQVPGRLAAIKNRYGLPFPVASDTGSRLARGFGIAFAPTPEAQARALARGSDLSAELGTGSWELPMPTVVVIDSSRVVRFADVHPDWLVRTEAEAVIDAVRALVQVTA